MLGAGLVVREPLLSYKEVVEVAVEQAVAGLPRGGGEPPRIHVAKTEAQERSEHFSSNIESFA
jgi:hypothetical protein